MRPLSTREPPPTWEYWGSFH